MTITDKKPEYKVGEIMTWGHNIFFIYEIVDISEGIVTYYRRRLPKCTPVIRTSVLEIFKDNKDRLVEVPKLVKLLWTYDV